MGRRNQSNGSKSGGRVLWSDEEFRLFVDICIRGTNLGKRRGGGWGSSGWTWVDDEMNAAGMHFTKVQLKHKWDWMQGQWKLWKELIGKQDELEWDHSKGTIIASDEWWNEKIQKNSDFSKLREKGIGPNLYSKYEYIFTGTISKVDYMDAPSFGILPCDVEKFDDVTPRETTGDSQEDFENSLEKGMPGVIVLGTSSNQAASRTMGDNGGNVSPATKKRKVNEEKKQQSSATQLSNTGRELKESRKECKEIKISPLYGRFWERPGMSIAEVMEDVLSLPDMEEGSDLHLFSTILLEQKSKREMYVTLKSAEGKRKWLQYYHTLWTDGKWKLDGQFVA